MLFSWRRRNARLFVPSLKLLTLKLLTLKLLTLALLTLALLTPALCHAQSDAAQQFSEALERFHQGDCEGALPRFKQAYATTHSPNARLYIARCLVQAGRVVEGYDEMKGTVDLANRRAATDPKYFKTRDAAASELAALDGKVAKVVVAFDTEYDDAIINVSGRLLSADEHRIPLVVQPGRIEVTASAPGKLPFSATLDIAAGSVQTVGISLQAADKADEGMTPLRVSGIAVTGAGAIGLLVAAITGGLASSKFAQLEDECGGTRCTDPSHAEVVDDGKRMETIANVSLATGLLLAAGGVTMILLGNSDGEAEPDDIDAQAKLIPLPGGGLFHVGVTF